jgi:hypothetical protein
VVSVVVLAGATSATAAPSTDLPRRAPVHMCRVGPPPWPGVVVPTVPPVPASVVLPDGVTLPAGAEVYGFGYPGGSATFAVGPRGFRCDPEVWSADGALYLTLTDPSDRRYRVDVTYSPGGVGYSRVARVRLLHRVPCV